MTKRLFGGRPPSRRRRSRTHPPRRMGLSRWDSASLRPRLHPTHVGNSELQTRSSAACRVWSGGPPRAADPGCPQCCLRRRGCSPGESALGWRSPDRSGSLTPGPAHVLSKPQGRPSTPPLRCWPRAGLHDSVGGDRSFWWRIQGRPGTIESYQHVNLRNQWSEAARTDLLSRGWREPTPVVKADERVRSLATHFADQRELISSRGRRRCGSRSVAGPSEGNTRLTSPS